MDLQKLLDAMNAAKAELDKNPEDAGLKSKFEAAKKAYDDAKASADADDDSEGAADDESAWDEKTKAYIAKLRAENAKHRTEKKSLKDKLGQTEAQKKAMLKAVGIEDESESPEEKLKQSQETTNQLLFRTAVLETAVQNGITGDQVDYLQFLVQQEAAKLGDGEELSDDQMAILVSKAKKVAGGGKANTSVDGKGKGGTPPPAGGGGNGPVTLDQFARMTMSQKGELYQKNPDLYEQLRTEAKEKNRLI